MQVALTKNEIAKLTRIINKQDGLINYKSFFNSLIQQK